MGVLGILSRCQSLRHLQTSPPGLLTLNLGSGQGHTVRQVVQAYGRELPLRVVGRRPGDAARSVVDPRLAQELLGWQRTRNLQQMCSDSWRWQSGQALASRR